MKWLLIIPIAVIIFAMIGCTSPTPTYQPEVSPSQPAPQTQVTPPPEAESQLIKKWTGTGIKTTEPFVIYNKPWVISWAHEPEMMAGQSMGILQIMVYRTSNPDFPITFAANSMDAESDTSYIYETGEFFLTINAANTNWAVGIIAVQ